MSRLLLLLVLVAQSPYRRDVRDFGAVPGVVAAQATNRRAIQAAIDACPPAGGEVYLPAGNWIVDQSLFLDRDRVGLVGDGPGRSFLSLAPFRGGAVVHAGIPRGKTPIGLDHWVDPFGRLDATVAPTPGVRWGYRTKGDSHLTFGPGTFDRGPGDYWAGATACTIELAIDGPAPVCGIVGASRGGRGDPVAIVSRPAELYVTWTTADGSLTGGLKWAVTFPTLTMLAPGVHRVVIQVDLLAPSVDCWVDGRRQAPKGGDSPNQMAAAAIKAFRAAQGNPWQVGLVAASATAATGDYYNSDPAPDLTLLALRVSSVPRYALTDALTRRDGRPITDLNTFFSATPGGLDPGTVGFLRGDEPPADLAPVRRLPVVVPGGVAAGLVVEPWQAANTRSVAGVSIRGLAVQSSNTPGVALDLGMLLDFTAEDCAFFGGDQGVGNANWGSSNYVNRFRRCQFAGADAAIRTYSAMTELADCGFPRAAGRYVLWNTAGLLRARNTMVAYGEPLCVYRGDRGATAILEHLDVDIETGRSPTYAAFYAETATDRGADAGGLTLDEVNLGSFLRTRPLIKLVDGARNPARLGWLEVRGHWVVAGVYPALVECDGGWAGAVDVRPLPFPTVTGAGAAAIQVRGAAPAVTAP